MSFYCHFLLLSFLIQPNNSLSFSFPNQDDISYPTLSIPQLSVQWDHRIPVFLLPILTLSFSIQPNHSLPFPFLYQDISSSILSILDCHSHLHLILFILFIPYCFLLKAIPSFSVSLNVKPTLLFRLTIPLLCFQNGFQNLYAILWHIQINQ